MIYTIHMDRDAVPVAGDKSGESRFDSLTASVFLTSAFNNAIFFGTSNIGRIAGPVFMA